MKRFRIKKPEIHSVADFCNFFAVPLQFLACWGVYFIIEWCSRHSFGAAWSFMTGSPAVFLVNTLMIFMTSTIVFLFRKRIYARIAVFAFWIFLGVVNGIVLSNRVTPFTGPDLRLLGDAKKIFRNYLSAGMTIAIIVGIALLIIGLVFMWRKAPKYKGEKKLLPDLILIGASVAVFFASVNIALNQRVLSSYFGNLAAAYQDYGFPYCFAVTLFDTGINQPNGYSEELIDQIVKSEKTEETEIEDKTNVIFVQLESFFDPTSVEFLNISGDPIPNYRRLMKEYSSGYLTVPVVGAGTVNTEFEAITGMNLRYFGAGEYPYKTVLKKETCESIPYILKNEGYDTHAIHNNEANFYGRKSVYRRLGFETFTSEEYMEDTRDKTETGWVKDHYLTNEILKCLDSTTNPDYIYTISVQGHGDYPTEPVIDDPKFQVTGAEGRDQNNNSWEYYCEQINEMDQFVKELTDTLAEYPERCVVVFYGDHLPTMGLETEDLTNRYLYQTQYLIWDNFGMERKEQNLTSYQIGSAVLDRIGVHDGTLIRYHQTRKNTKNYQLDMEDLQYDMLYGKKYVYGGESPFQETNLRMGIDHILFDSISRTQESAYVIHGKYFNAYSKLEINGEIQADTVFLNSETLYLSGVELKNDDQVCVIQQSASATAKALSRTGSATAWQAMHGGTGEIKKAESMPKVIGNEIATSENSESDHSKDADEGELG